MESFLTLKNVVRILTIVL